MLSHIMEIAQQAGELIRTAADITPEEKTGFRDLVTQYDRQVQALLQSKLRAVLPQAAFLGEEGAFRPDGDALWEFIVDPIDGTTNFVQGFPNCCVSIGLLHRGQMELGVIYNPFTRELYSARRGQGAYRNGRRLQLADRDLQHSLCMFGSSPYYPELTELSLSLFGEIYAHAQDVRRFGSAALDFCYVADGRAGVYYECRLCPWDIAAGSLIAQEAGAVVSTLTGQSLPFDRKCSVAVGAPTAWAQMCNRFAPHIKGWEELL